MNYCKKCRTRLCPGSGPWVEACGVQFTPFEIHNPSAPYFLTDEQLKNFIDCDQFTRCAEMPICAGEDCPFDNEYGPC